MQFNPHVAILKIRGRRVVCPVAFAGGHASPDPTPSHYTDVFSRPSVQTNLLTRFTTQESTHQAVSAAVTQRLYRVAHWQPGPAPPGLLRTKGAFITAFHLLLSFFFPT